MKMEKYVIDILKRLKPEKTVVKKLRNERDFLFVRDKAKKILVLNHTAREIYNACNGANVGKIIRTINSRYPDIDIERISIDVLICLRDLETRGLLALR
jgi:nucleoside-diphosphate-sugar epimerase